MIFWGRYKTSILVQ